MDSQSVPAARPSWAEKGQRKMQAQKQQTQKAPKQRPSTHYDSDASTTIDSLKDLMAASQRGDFRHGPTREDDILFAAKHARAQMPPQFREPPSSTGSHGTITQSSIHMDDESSVSTFSADLPDAESTRASLHPYHQRSSRPAHRVHKPTGRFGAESRSTHRPKTVEDVLDGVVNTSALFRTFKEWRPEDAPSVRSDGDAEGNDAEGGLTQESTQMGVLDKLVAAREAREKEQKEKEKENKENKENQGSLRTAARKSSMRGILQATVQNESDMSIVMSAAVPEKPSQPAKASQPVQIQIQTQTQTRPPSPRQTVSLSAATAAAAKKAGSVQSRSSQGSSNNNKKMVSLPAMASPVEDDLSAPETSADSHEEEKYGRPRTTLMNNYLDHHDRFEALDLHGLDHLDDLDDLDSDQSDHFDDHHEQHDQNEHDQNENDQPEEHPDALTNQSFVVPAKSFPLLHNLVTGTLHFTPGTFFYGMSAQEKQPYQLPPGRLPADEKKIFVDVDKIREEVVRLQEHDEMLQNEIVQGERKYQALVERFYGLAKASDSGLGSDPAAPEEWHGVLQGRIAELEAALAAAQAQKDEHAQAAGEARAQRDAAEARAAAATDKAKKLEASRRKPTTPVGPPLGASTSADAQRRIRQLEQMVAERERVIGALRDEREAAASSHREASRLLKERLARLAAEKNMVSGDHAKCGEERRALAEALAAARAALREQRQQAKAARQQTQEHLREQARAREAVLRTALERQRAQTARQRAQLRSHREKGVRQLDEAFRRLRESWAAGGSGREETVTMTDVLGEWKEEDEEEDELDELDNLVNPERLDDGVPADLSMDENMTSAFIIPDLDFAARVETDDEDEDDEPTPSPSPVKKVSFATKTTTASHGCPHQRANCVVCRQQAGPATEARVTVAVRRPDTVQAQARAKIAGMDPGSALAFVMKLLDDERRHLWMQIEARRHEGMPSPVPSTRDPETARQARRESDALWQAYVRKVEQLNRLDDVVAGQAAAGQAMTPAEVDVTITRILGETEEW